ncbi:hypothetical protein DVH24_041972 [Malus domestica]|uniref:RNA helicase n=1 Tax=Malus domestica TaxID=3750 RepID=A0A498ISP3_MALDO|nr:hypothetical protein DVH24_041972 [Malus domestica]
MVKRSNDRNEKCSRTRRRLGGLNAVGDDDGDAAQGTSKVRNGRVQLGTKFVTLLRVKESSRQRKQQQKQKRREITAQGGTSKTQVEVEREITTSVEVQEYRQQRGITVSSRDVPNPIRTLGRTPFPEYVKEEFLNAGFIRPTPIQAQAWPIALEGRDIIGIAPPGSGKKVAYLLPAIVHMKSRPKLSCGDGPIVLILAPTPDRSIQIQQECTKFAAAHIEALCGEQLIGYKNSRVACGVGILIDTPDGVLNALESCRTNLRKIPPDCQKLFSGSSWPEEADELARPFLSDACKVEVGSPVLKATHPIDQIVDIVAEDQKYNKLGFEVISTFLIWFQIFRLVGLLGDIADGSRILIFMDIKKGCESCNLLAQKLSDEGYAVSVNEKVCQSDRVQIVSGFQGGYIPIMIATDAAARDLVLKNVKYVINYDFPGSIDDYVYRIVLAEPKGTAYTFFTTANARCAKELTILLKEAGQKVGPELAALGRDVRYPESFIPGIPRGAASILSKVTGVVYFPIYPHCPEAKTAASFAVDKVNEKKKLQLHFVRVVEAYECLSGIPVRVTYVTLEAADGTACEMNAYGAIVARWGITGKVKTVYFGRVKPSGRMSALFDIRKKLDNRVYKIWPESSRKLREYPSIADNERQRERKGALGVATD